MSTESNTSKTDRIATTGSAPLKRDSLAFKLGRTFFFIGFLATVVTALTAYIVAQNYLRTEKAQKLQSICALLQQNVEQTIERARDDLAMEAVSPDVQLALRDFSRGRNLLEQELDQQLRGGNNPDGLNEELAALIRERVAGHYRQSFLEPLLALRSTQESELLLSDFLQPDIRTNLLQYNILLETNAGELPDAQTFRDAFAQTSYAQALTEHESFFLNQSALLDNLQIYLVDVDGYVVYSTSRLIDFHADLKNGPQQNSGLGVAYQNALQIARAGMGMGDSGATAPPQFITAMEPYLPSGGIPHIFLSTPVFTEEGAPLGVLIYRMPFTNLNDYLTQSARQSAVGLGDSGEAFLVELSDRVMLTNARVADDLPTPAEADGDAALQPLSVEFLQGDDTISTNSGAQPVSLDPFLGEALQEETEAAAEAENEQPAPAPSTPLTAVYTNYAGNTVIGAFAPLTVAGLDWGLLVEQSVAEAFAPARGLALAIFIAGLIVLALIGLVSFFTARGISRPVQALESAMTRSAAGDDRVRAEVVGNDELARLAETFNRMTAERGRIYRQTTQDNDRLQSNIEELLIVAAEASEGKLGVRARVTEGQLGNIASALNIMLENVANFIEQIRVASGRVASASVEIATSSGDLAQGVSEQTQQVEQTNEQLQALSDQSERVVSVTESAASAAEETRMAAARGADAVEEMGQSMAQIREKVQVNAQKIKRLGERSMEISGIVKSISDISAQTDMLAFNASVESERGAEGRGFSMVADRVRDLAERTKQATAEIERLVSGIQNETAEAVLQMEKMTEEVERGTSKVQAANTSLEEIVGASNKSSDLVEEIRNIAGSQRQEARRVLDAMVTLSEIADRAEQKVQQNRQTSEQLADLSSDLNAQISEFDTEGEDREEPGAPARLMTS